MRKKILIALGVLGAILVILVAVIALQPSEFRVERSATIAAPAPEVYAQVNDFHHWEAWSPWAKLDPSAKNTFAGAPAGEGAIFMWSGNDEVGEGRMTIMESHPSDLVRIKLEFVRPFASTCTSQFTFKSAGDQTMVTWTMYGPNNFMAKAVHLYMDIDKLVGGDFEKGLAQMKSVVEAKTKK